MTTYLKDGGIKCNCCDNRAVVNYQKLWVRWKIDKQGNYSKHFKEELDLEEPVGDENLHLCGECAEKFRNGELEI